jgi:hypothetical protein
VVVSLGLTLIVPAAFEDVKFPGVMAIVVARFVDQLSVLLDPELTLAGDAVNAVTVGGANLGPPEEEVAAAHPANTMQTTKMKAGAPAGQAPVDAPSWTHPGSTIVLRANDLGNSIPTPFPGHVFPKSSTDQITSQLAARTESVPISLSPWRASVCRQSARPSIANRHP